MNVSVVTTNLKILRKFNLKGQLARAVSEVLRTIPWVIVVVIEYHHEHNLGSWT